VADFSKQGMVLRVLSTGLACLLVLAAGCSGGGGEELPEGNLFLSDWFLNIAHRGGKRVAPEETIPAYQDAVAVGVDVLEMDLHATSDGVIVLMHDSDVERTTDGEGAIKEMTFAELRELDAGYDFTTDGGETYPYRGQGVVVPSLEEVLDAYGDLYFIMELKQASPSIVDAVLELLERKGVTERVILASATDGTIEEVREKKPEVFTSLALGEMITLITMEPEDLENYSPPARFLHPPSESVEPEFMELARRFDFKVHAWTVNDRETMERLINLGVEGIMTDDPAGLEEVIDDLGLH